MIHTTHRAKVAKDPDADIWSAFCDCETVWNGVRWQDVYAKAFNHVRIAQHFERLGGAGFRSSKNELH